MPQATTYRSDTDHRMVKVAPLETPVEALTTVTETFPLLNNDDAGTAAFKLWLDTYVVTNDTPFQLTTLLGV